MLCGEVDHPVGVEGVGAHASPVEVEVQALAGGRLGHRGDHAARAWSSGMPYFRGQRRRGRGPPRRRPRRPSSGRARSCATRPRPRRRARTARARPRSGACRCSTTGTRRRTRSRPSTFLLLGCPGSQRPVAGALFRFRVRRGVQALADHLVHDPAEPVLAEVGGEPGHPRDDLASRLEVATGVAGHLLELLHGGGQPGPLAEQRRRAGRRPRRCSGAARRPTPGRARPSGCRAPLLVVGPVGAPSSTKPCRR